MKSLLALTIASFYGLTIRMIFGYLSPNLEVMSLTFLGLVPVLIGFLTVRFSPEDKIKNNWQAFSRPWLTSLVILLLSILLAIEGAICWIMIYPFFATAAGIGGLLALQLRRKREKPDTDNREDLLDDNWDDFSQLKLSVVLLLPLAVGLIESDRTTSRRNMQVEESLIVAAPPAAVWAAITTPGRVEAHEKGTRLTDLIGFPQHLYTTLDTVAAGGRRVAHYEGGLYFEETITEIIPREKLVLDIHVDPAKVPHTVLDEHIVIGGKHVDVIQDVYRLTALPDGSTRVTLTSDFYISTPFNWYAGWWADLLLGELLRGELRMVQGRAEKH